MGMVLDSFNNPPVVDQFALSYTGPYTGGFTGGPPCNPQVDDIAGNNAYFNALCVNGVQIGPPSFIQSLSVVGVQLNPTTNSVSPAFVDLPDITITFTIPVKSNVLALFSGVFASSITPNVVSLAFNIDNTGIQPIGSTNFSTNPTANGADTFTTTLLFPNVAPGTHTIKVQWATTVGVVTASGSTRTEILIIFPNP